MSPLTLPPPGASTELLLHGPAGRVEALLAAPRASLAPPAFAVICHPHPLFGGALTNKVAYTLAGAAQKAGAYALRFNFRGVGRSEGQHDEGRGETDDVLFLVAALRAALPDARAVLAGFSFGAFVSLQAAARVQPAALVSIAPPFGKYFGDAPVPPRPACPWLVIHARDDEVVAFAETAGVLAGYAPPPRLVTPDHGGHFFHGRLAMITQHVVPFLQDALSSP